MKSKKIETPCDSMPNLNTVNGVDILLTTIKRMHSPHAHIGVADHLCP